MLAAFLVALLISALTAAAASAAPGVPRTYTYKAIDSGAPAGGSSFGWGVASADLTGDGKPDLIVAQGTGAQASSAPTHVFVYDGVTGALLETINPPEANFDGSDPVIGFVYVETMPDIGGCPGGDGGDSDLICDASAISGGDGIPEIIIGARELQVDANATAANQDAQRGAGDPKIGRGYVIDGASAGAGNEVVLKRIDMPLADRQLTTALGGGAAQFARVMMVPQGLPPCAGPASEVNDLGVGPCPSDPSIYPQSVKIGDVTGGGRPDLILTARNFREALAVNNELQTITVRATAGEYTLTFGADTTANIPFNATAAAVDAALEGLPSIGAGNVTVSGGPGNAGGTSPYSVTFGGALGNTDVAQLIGNNVSLTGGTPSSSVTVNTSVQGRPGGTTAPTGSQCATATGPPGSCTAGKAWVYRGEDIAGTDPHVILDTAAYAVQNPFPQNTSGTEFGGNVWRVGEVSNPPDAKPDFVVAARNTSYPLTSPDNNLQPAVGVAYEFSGANGARVQVFPHPQPQPRATFSASFNSGRPAGDLGDTGLPDVVLPAPLQNNLMTDDGIAYVFRGDVAGSGGGGQQSWQFAQMNDPNPVVGGGFGSSTTGVGDLVGGVGAAQNEMMIGSWAPFDPFTEATKDIIGDVHIVNPQFGVNFQTITDPTGEPGAGFGIGMTPMGDLNGDGFLDFGITAYLSDAPPGGLQGQGRAYILYSDNTPLPTPAQALKSGDCTNEKDGTSGADVLTGTDHGDVIFAKKGDDAIQALAANDCVDAGAGNDRASGDDGNDSLVAGDGRDRLVGGLGDDQLFGEKGRDVLKDPGGRNTFVGGGGKDVIRARNGDKDTISCGKGRDKVKADRQDRIDVDCESVRT
ncbi:MAG: calcium-binding protein [Solirubrobacterales bacterium]